MRLLKTGAFVAAIIMTLSSLSHAMWMRPEEVPLQRLLKNVGSYVKANPKDAQGFYTLGRLHSLAFAVDTDTTQVYTGQRGQVSDKRLPQFPSYQSVVIRRSEKVTSLTREGKTHLLESVRHYRRATQLAPSEALYWLGLGWMLEEGSHFATKLGLPPDERKRRLSSTAIVRVWQDKALAAYRRAYALNIKADSSQNTYGPGPEPISIEAGEGIVRLLKGRRLVAVQQKEISDIEATIKSIRSKPRVVTPIIFPLDKQASLNELLMPDHKVAFDLAGNGLSTSWPWVKPDTGILVWDPKGTGQINSGRQLFGSVTWWMFWKDGYEALAALDDNKDGWLRGRELKGIAVWCDRNSNGASDRGEVVSLSSLGITQIAAQSDGKHEGIVYNAQGLRRNDGTFLPTYDWTPTPHAER